MTLLEEGVYVYENGKPVQVESLDLSEGRFVVFFDNRKCAFCRIFDVMWDVLVKDPTFKGVRFVKVVCSYFASDCSNEKAKSAYIEHEVWKSPTVLLIDASNKDSKRTERFTPSQYNYDLQQIKKAVARFFSLEV